MKRSFFLVWLLVLWLPASALAQWDLGDLYTDSTLRHWQGKYTPNVRWNFENLILGRLTPQELERIGPVTLDLPLRARGELRNQPLLFYAAGNTITAPILSIKFIDEITQAWAYLWSKGHDLDLVADYIAMLKYRSPGDFPGGRIPPPLEALGIPEDAWQHDKRMDDVSQKALKSAIVWILAHELGHIYHRHPGYGAGLTTQEVQENERQADRFANQIMRRIGVAPVGMVQVFMAMAFLDAGRYDFASADAWRRYLTTEATHPLSADRLSALARDLRRAPRDFTTEETDQAAAAARIHYIADQVAGIGAILDDPDMHRLVVAIGLATDLASLQRRRRALGEVEARKRCAPEADSLAFSGVYTGVYARNLANGRIEQLSAKLRLQREGSRVVGRFTFGLGEGELRGQVVQGRRLVYDWQWGNAFGKGSLEGAPTGGLRGAWGFEQETAGGGEWDLCRTGP